MADGVPGVDSARKADELKILIFSDRDIKHPWGGGSLVNIHEQAKRWVRMGHRVTMITTRPRGHARRDTIDGLEVYRAGNRYTVYLCAPVLYLLGLRKRADAVVDIINGVPFFTPLFCRKPKVAIMHHVHKEMFLIELGPVLGRIGRAIERYVVPLMYRRVHFISSSRSTVENMRNLLFHGSKLRISVAYNGIDHDFYKAGAGKRERPTVLYLGRVKKYKRVPLLISMMKSVREQVKDAELLIAGGGDAVTDSRGAIERMGAGDYIRYLGFVSEEEKLRLFQEAWVQATASLVEGWGLTVVEANACGTPAVSFRVPGLRESIIDGETGRLADGEEEFVSHLVDILTDAGLRRRLTRGAEEWARRFDWDRTAAETLEVIRLVMEESAARREGPAGA